ncbi:hypothetical protein F444_21639 [Phytophthora nicotianae P1976]|uniref:DDE Tnp4 domain-containing protein n=1 Tax=Phytophthora nicotianae P1976 TaxID=1317066 RepID=A0A080Z0G4_PHYNI|nr:hypothetical protein F444_21639 [Phytophthora nicotianae P1976]
MTGEDSDVLLVLADAFRRQSDGLRREVFRLLVEEARRVAMRSRHYLTTQCLDTPNESAWVILYKYGTDINFLNAASLTRIAFGNLLRRFVGFYYIPRLQPRGRPFKLRFHHQVLGLVLCYYTGSMELGTLRSAHKVFDQFPTRTYIVAIAYAPGRAGKADPGERTSAGAYVWFHRRKNFKVQQPSNADLQNAMYNGWLHSVFMTGTICFAADGCIIWCKHNCPGSWNDSDTSLGFRNRLLDPTYCPDPRKNVVSDSAFP